MSNYVKVLPGTDMWEKFNKVYTCKQNWHDNKEELEAFLGFPYTNLMMSTERLAVKLSAVREHRPEWLTHFKKDGTSKVRSSIHKEWLELVERLGLEYHDLGKVVAFHVNSRWGSVKSCVPVGDDYYLKVTDDFNYKGCEWAEPVKESVFLKLQAEDLEANGK